MKAIIFDFFDVLVLHGSDSFLLTYFPNDPEKNSQVKQLQLDRERGTIDFGHFVSKLAAVGGVDQKIVLKHIDNYQPNVQLLSYIRNKLKPKYKIGMISNTEEDWPSKILGAKNIAMFDDIFLSHKTDLTGLDARFYKMVADNLKVKVEDCTYIGYIPSYCEAAETTGMKSLCYWGIKQIEGEFGQTR